jgi:FAD/FMN-containing dehydrogenase
VPTVHRPPGFNGVFRDDEDARAAYAEAAGIGRAIPGAVAVPEDAEDVAALVRWARDTGTALVPRGSGSSMAGGAIGPGVIVDLSRLNVIRPVDVERRTVRAGPGALCADVERAARAAGLRFPVSPSSARFCTVGGMAGTNAAGAQSMKFGAMRTWTTGLDCVFDDGTAALVRRGDELTSYAGVAAIQRFAERVMPAIFTAAMAEPVARIRHPEVRKESSGYAIAEFARSGHLVDLFVGSEGTLALFTGVELRLAPAPAATAAVLAAFASLEEAVEGARRAREAGAVACELLDRTFLDVTIEEARALDVPPGTEAVLIGEAEGATAEEAREGAALLERAFAESGATRVRLAPDEHAGHEIWALRHAASPILARLDPSLRSMQFVEDACVPPDRLPDYVRGVRALLAKHDIRGVVFGHAGDANVHVNPLVDVSRDGWRARIEALLDDATALVADLGGTLAGEHGDGRLRAPLLERVWARDALVLFDLVKRVFDPAGILNPGAKLPLAAQRAIEDVKYDPSLPALPGAARRVLDRVAEERAYGRSRLAMLEEETGAA